MFEKICPLAAHGDERMHYGCIPTCAWYDESTGKCAVVLMAQAQPQAEQPKKTSRASGKAN